MRELYVTGVAADGRLGEPEVLYSDLPDVGQHPDRTLKFSPDGRLFLSPGSTSNAAREPNPEYAPWSLPRPPAAQFGRLGGLAVARDGAMLFSDDSGGIIYRVAARRGAGHAAATLRARWSR